LIGGWRELHNELHNLYSSPSILRIIEDEMGRACSRNGREEEFMKYIDVKTRRDH
jgi:hypothetical protein